MSVIGAATRVAATYYWRCRFKAEIEFGTQRILFREVSKSRHAQIQTFQPLKCPKMQKKQSVTDRRTDRPTDRPTDTVTYRSRARDKNL